MNVFLKPEIAKDYDSYYQTEFGKQVDDIEKDIVREILKDIPTGKMLEMGCGTGHWTSFFVDLGFDVTALDSSPAMLQYTSDKNIDVEFIQADAENLPFDDESFPVVASITMLEFVDDQDKVLSEAFRVLKKGGTLVLGCLNANSVLGKTKESSDTFRNAKFMTPDELHQKLSQYGGVEIKSGVFITDDFQLLGEDRGSNNAEPVFMGAIVKMENV